MYKTTQNKIWGQQRMISHTAIKWHKKPLQLQIKLQVINLIQKNKRIANLVIQPTYSLYSALESLKIRHERWSTNQKQVNKINKTAIG